MRRPVRQRKRPRDGGVVQREYRAVHRDRRDEYAQVRFGHTATLLSDGRVLIVGGQTTDGGYVATCEYFYPVAGKFAAVAGLTAARAGHRAELLHNGLLLVAGGANSGNPALALTELYVPATAAEMGIAPF
jgi:hypothetical protein